MLKRMLKRYLFGLLATTYCQPVFEQLYKLALWGMNIGLGSNVEDSGELYALKRFAKALPLNFTPVVFDVGANRGHFSLAALEILGLRTKIYCFEPSVAAFRLLRETLRDYPMVRCYNLGFGEYESSATLYLDKEASGCASLYERKGLVIELAEQVQIRTLDGFCAENDINRIHYLKLDVEGHELAVLRGGQRMLTTGAIDWLQFEFGGCNVDSRTYFRDFFDLLNPQYAIYRLLRNGFALVGSWHETREIFTTTNFIAIRRDGVIGGGRLA
jgi:FkbM family methyltransferase